ncbi:hypothetical protein NDU88_002346 [Pleurodeles waltl]|uniref:Uncharacterized protein n=1 Tax=Pleurodeles waltl TaxID=8319 RepID=A0AAV7WKY8_PLEWA|nr:hypothetical protein NDU88_002346 [Pleurodeles waltl]
MPCVRLGQVLASPQGTVNGRPLWQVRPVHIGALLCLTKVFQTLLHAESPERLVLPEDQIRPTAGSLRFISCVRRKKEEGRVSPGAVERSGGT